MFHDVPEAYGQSKLTSLLFTVELAKRYEAYGVTSVCANPGLVRDQISLNFHEFGDAKSLINLTVKIVRWIISKNSKQGAQTIIHCAVDESIERLNGKYFSECKCKKLLKPSSCDELAGELWTMSRILVGLKM